MLKIMGPPSLFFHIGGQTRERGFFFPEENYVPKKLLKC